MSCFLAETWVIWYADLKIIKTIQLWWSWARLSSHSCKVPSVFFCDLFNISVDQMTIRIQWNSECLGNNEIKSLFKMTDRQLRNYYISRLWARYATVCTHAYMDIFRKESRMESKDPSRWIKSIINEQCASIFIFF